mmetsp:Transcript_13161/g.22294  ORF Transcript_13161/g.22294 Transcript_13161/m.22294 type:complete len:228 (+) Transcript_13161:577-1260(+)
MIEFLSENQDRVNDMIEHIYLNTSIVDTIVRICCIQQIDSEHLEMLNSLRSDILSNVINKLEHHQDDVFMTEQIFCILSGLLRKCYAMLDGRKFFEELLSPFILKPILDYTFQENFGQNTKLGADFLTLMIFNLFISEPQDAYQDVLDYNFGFEVSNPAPQQAEEDSKEAEEKKDDDAEKSEEEKKEEPQKGEDEFSAMQQAERAKNALIKGKQKIFDRTQIDPLIT